MQQFQETAFTETAVQFKAQMDMINTVLLVEDDAEVAAAVREILGQLGFEVRHFMDGRLGLEEGLAQSYALVVLDIKLPSMDGLEICKRIRAARADQAILMLTGETDEMSTILGLELGADEYINKPFRAKEFRARVSALLRRYRAITGGAVKNSEWRTEQTTSADAPPLNDATESEQLHILSSGQLEVNELLQAAFVNAKKIPLTPTEFRLLVILLTNKNRLFTAEQLSRLVLGYDSHIEPSTIVRAHISRLRRKLEKAGVSPKCVVTDKGFGYRFQDEEDIS